MNHKTKTDFSISGNIAFNPEENYNYVVVKGLHRKIESSDNIPSISTTKFARNKNKKQSYENIFEPEKQSNYTKNLETKRSNLRPVISPITNEKIPREHDYFKSPNKLVKLRSIKDSPQRVKLQRTKSQIYSLKNKYLAYGILQMLMILFFVYFQSASLKPYLQAVRYTLDAAICLENFSSQKVRSKIYITIRGI